MLCLLEESVRVVLRELRLLCWSWGGVLELVRIACAEGLVGELEICSLALELGLWMELCIVYLCK